MEEMLFLFVVALVLLSFFTVGYAPHAKGDRVPSPWRYVLYGVGVVILIAWLVRLTQLRGD